MSEPIAQPTPNHLIADAPWERYRRPYVRDLAYALACPNVLTQWLDFAPHENTHAIAVHSASFWQAQFEAYEQRLTELDTTNDYQALTRYLLKRPSPNRLGFHFEGLLSFWLEDGFARELHPYETLANNVQLYNGKQTTGELDLILYNHAENLVEHWELAIKFFMGSAPFEPENWVGINSNDNLQRKMTHMQTKQFRTVWVDTESHGQVKIDKRYGVIKGRFFLPKNIINFVYPSWLVPSFPMHEWCDKYDTSTLAMLDIRALRAAHYIEWFTKREFYDGRPSALIHSEKGILKTGLYFEGDRPIVIYPKQHDETDDKF
ncbi:DUF1853 family protein [Psychrobacter sp. ASPA161_6]|uniref:DUF1853 family protein n=1 Tax=Psychrobacter sp. ASPA161_6 TaxID=3160962 RepID=UPI003F800E03